MALPALANEGFVEKGHFAPVPQLRMARGPANHERAPTIHEQQADRLRNSHDRRPLHRVQKLPLMARIGIIGVGALLGWSVPIAVATTLVH